MRPRAAVSRRFTHFIIPFLAAYAIAAESDEPLTNARLMSTSPPRLGEEANFLSLQLRSTCPADLDGDGFIGIGDLSILLADFGCMSGGCPGDIDGDGTTGIADLSLLLAVFGESCPIVGGIDLDIDSNNTNGTDLPDRSPEEEEIEDDPNLPGKFILVNNDDDDRNGVPDMDQDGAIPEEQDDLVPIVIEIFPQKEQILVDYRLIYPGNVRVWRSPIRGSLSTDVVQSGAIQTYDVVSGPVTLWVEGLSPSFTGGDVRIVAEADTNGDGEFESSDAVRATVVSLTPSTTTGPLGTEVIWTISPAVMPVSFDASTTAIWTGIYQPLIGPPSATFTNSFSAAQIRNTTSNTATIVVGDGTFSGAPDPTTLNDPGILYGNLAFAFGSLQVRRTFHFAPASGAATWEDVDYPDGPGGSADPILDGEPPDLPVLLLSGTPNPMNPSEALLLGANGFHIAAVVRIKENPTTIASAPATILVDLVSFDSNDVELDRVPGLVLSKISGDDGDPKYITYHNDLTIPIVLVDVNLNKSAYPNVIPFMVVGGGSAVIVPTPE